jgi:RimJ/RimL family protein N-acetyltransferase
LEINPNPSAIFKADTLTLRRMHPGDADGLMDLMNAGALGPLRSNLPRSISESVRASFLRNIKDDFRFVAVCACKIIGQVCLRSSSQRTATLTISIREDFRRSGVATALLEQIIIAARQRSEWDCIEADVFDANHAAIRLYEKSGFEIKSFKTSRDGCNILSMSKSIK